MAFNGSTGWAFGIGDKVRVQPGRFLVVASAKPVQDNIHVDLKQHVKGKIYGDKSKEPDSDPRESIYAQRCYRVWVQEGLVGDATLLLVPEVRLSPFYECATCGRYAEDPCAGCENVYYCDHACQEAHWKAGHAAECDRRSADNHLLGDTSLLPGERERQKHSRSQGAGLCMCLPRTLSGEIPGHKAVC